jgi:hypothetical protein
MSSLPICETGVALPSFATHPYAPADHAWLGELTPESTFGGERLLGFSVLRRAAGMPMAVLGW